MPPGDHVGTMFYYGYSKSDVLGDLVAVWSVLTPEKGG